jgi:molybdopterin synthase sulfur carrier subunit
MAQVRVNLYATLRRHIDGAPSIDVEIEAGQSVQQVLGQLGVPPERTRIIFVNSRAATLAQALQDGDEIGVFPAIGGG